MDLFPSSTTLTHGRGYVYSLQYHLVWCTKYRRPVLTGDIRTDVIAFLRRTADDLDIEITAMEVMPDHIHLLISAKPQCRISDAVKVFKGNLSRWMFMEHPELKSSLQKGHMWNPSYYIETVSDRSEKRIRQYIESQTERNSDRGIRRGIQR